MTDRNVSDFEAARLRRDLAKAEDLCRELAEALDDCWMFLGVHAQTYAAERKQPMADVHAEMLARVHAAMTKAHKAGHFPEATTARLPELIAEHGYDADALAAVPRKERVRT